MANASVMIFLKTKKDVACIKLLKQLNEQRSVALRELRKGIARSSLFKLTRYLEELNQHVVSCTGKDLMVREKRRVGKREFETYLRTNSILEFVEQEGITLVKVIVV